MPTDKRASAKHAKTVNSELKQQLAHKIELERQIQERKNEIEQLKKQYRYNLNEKQKFEELYHAVETSISWKITKPVRKIAEPLFKLRRAESVFRVEALKQKLLGLGLSERASAELEDIAHRRRNSPLRRLAAWEIAAWHANMYTKQSAQKCLHFLSIAEDHERDIEKLKRIAVLKAESLDLLGKQNEAKHALKAALNTHGQVADFYLGLSNLESAEKDKLEIINQALSLSSASPVTFAPGSKEPLYDRLTKLPAPETKQSIRNTARVTIIIPAYNAADTIHTSIDAMLNQTWENLEIIVADDCSTDSTSDVVKTYAKRDPRVKLVRGKKNGGPYVARNLALNEATGDFVTCHDSDDWSHHEKIQHQVEYLIKNPGVIANTSQQARANNDMVFHRRGNPGFYIQFNMSSLMFRREPVTRYLGYWDSVRFGADSEFIKRLKKTFGNSSVVNLPGSLLSFQRKSDESLTGSSKFGFHGFFMGARKEYVESQERHHHKAESLKYEFPQTKRPFPVPEPMFPDREVKKGQPRKFDVIYAADYRDTDKLKQILSEIKKLNDQGLKVGLVQLHKYDLNPRVKINPSVRRLLEDTKISMVVYGETVSCKKLVVNGSGAVNEIQNYVADITAEEAYLIIRRPNDIIIDKPSSRKGGDFAIKNFEKYFKTKPLICYDTSLSNNRYSSKVHKNYEPWSFESIFQK